MFLTNILNEINLWDMLVLELETCMLSVEFWLQHCTLLIYRVAYVIMAQLVNEFKQPQWKIRTGWCTTCFTLAL